MTRHHCVLDERRIVHGVVADRVSRTEALAVRLQHQDLDVIVAVGVEQCGINFLGQLLVLRIGLLRPVERDLRDRAVLLVDDALAGLLEIHVDTFRYEVMTPISAPMS
jgi:hypothetical protein